ncbi:MAG: hypothetical protein IH855_02380 [Bacteroidetes bacterium]|nr:hypothetical protein [Bacteroidota bacterium]
MKGERPGALPRSSGRSGSRPNDRELRVFYGLSVVLSDDSVFRLLAQAYGQ